MLRIRKVPPSPSIRACDTRSRIVGKSADAAYLMEGTDHMTYDNRDPKMMDDTTVKHDEGGTEAVGAGAGAIGGALVGGAVAGPPGALVGGAIGAIGGAIAGESTEGNEEAGAATGGATGAVAGAVIGGAIAGPPGALVGGAVGAAGGAGAGDKLEEEAKEDGTMTSDTVTSGAYDSTTR